MLLERELEKTVLWQAEEPARLRVLSANDSRRAVVVAGPGSSFTVPGIIVSEIVQAIAKVTQVTRVVVDSSPDLMAGLHRATSLAAAHGAVSVGIGSNGQVPISPRFRAQDFLDLIGPDVGTVVAYAWPGINNSWIRQFIRAGRTAGVLTVVACASLPQSSRARAESLAGIVAEADVILVGDEAEARALASAYGRSGPLVETHRALSLGGRRGQVSKQQITAFVPKDDGASLSTLLAAFDAIPEAWIDAYSLQVVMRHDDSLVPKLIAESYHTNYVQLIGGHVSSVELLELCAASSALSISEPAVDSRVYSTAVAVGIATVVLSGQPLPEVGHGYVGGFLADRNRPVSVHVALIHALRLAELRFPSPDSWTEFAQRIVGAREREHVELKLTVEA
jgi:hypothetical protein